MWFKTINYSLAILALALLGGASSSLESRQNTGSRPAPFGLEYAFSAYLTLGKPLPTVTVPGGVLAIEMILGGTVSGPLINATISAGIATPSIYENATLQVPVIQAWGLTEDGFGFVINELGIGSPKGQVTRIQLSIGGGAKYTSLRDGFILATVNPNANQTAVAVQGYLISNTAVYPEGAA